MECGREARELGAKEFLVICDECLQVSKDRVETVARANKGLARFPAVGYVCAKCFQKMLSEHGTSYSMNKEPKKKIK